MNEASLKRILARIDGQKPGAVESIMPDVDDGPIRAVLIDSPIVGPVWFAFEVNFKSGDAIPVFFASELPFLRKMSAEELCRRYAEKHSLDGGWIRDRTDDPTKH